MTNATPPTSYNLSTDSQTNQIVDSLNAVRNSANLPNTYNQGFCYFDISSGKFWIDTAASTASSIEKERGRIAINAYQADIADQAEIANLAYAATYETGPNANDATRKIRDYYAHELGVDANNIILFNGAEGVPIQLGNAISPIPFVIGSANDTTVGTWTGSCANLEDYSTYPDGFMVLYEPQVSGSTTTTLELNDCGPKTIYRSGTTHLTTQYATKTPILLVFSAEKDCWFCVNDYDTTTNTLVRTYASSTDVELPLIGGNNTGSTTATAPSLTSNYKNLYGAVPASNMKKATINPSTGKITVPGGIVGNLTGTATKAISDGGGNSIVATYGSDLGFDESTRVLSLSAVNGDEISTVTIPHISVIDNLTSSTITSQPLSAKQGYNLANGSARDNTKLPLSGGTMTGAITPNASGTINLGNNNAHWQGVYANTFYGALANSITIGDKSFSGAQDVVIELKDLHLSNPMDFKGIVTNTLVDGSSTPTSLTPKGGGDPIIVSQSTGEGWVVIDATGKEYIWSGSPKTWNNLGVATDFALAAHVHGNISNQGKIEETVSGQKAIIKDTDGTITVTNLSVSDLTGNDIDNYDENNPVTSFISNISQNSIGQISVTKTELIPYVKKSGDTMSGTLNINNTSAQSVLNIRSYNLNNDITPSDDTWGGYLRYSDNANNTIGYIQTSKTNTGLQRLSITSQKGSRHNYLRLETDGTNDNVVVSNAAAWRTGIGAVNIAGDTMTGNLIIDKSSTTNVDVSITVEAGDHAGSFLVGSSSRRLGIWDTTNQKWVVYSTTAGDVVLNGNANTASKADAANITTTENAIARYSDTEGTFADTGILIDDDNNMTVPAASYIKAANITIGGNADVTKNKIKSSSTLYIDRGNSCSILFQQNGTSKMRIDTADAFRPETTNTLSIGTSSYKWANMYATTFNGALNGNASTATGANLTTTANAIAYYTNTTGTFGTKASANGALYAESANGALKWGTLPVLQGGTGVTSIANIQAGKDGNGNTITSTYVKKAGDTMSGNLSISKAGEAYASAKNTNTGVTIYLDSAGTYHGIYSSGIWSGSEYTASGKWLVYRDSDGAVAFGSGIAKMSGLLQITNHSNTVQIGSANASYCHFSNSANIPFYFNQGIWVDGFIGIYQSDSAAVGTTLPSTGTKGQIFFKKRS